MKATVVSGAAPVLVITRVSTVVLPGETAAGTNDLAIVGATYPRRMWPLGFIGNRLDGAAFSLADTGLIEAARMPAGCLLLKAEVFSKIKPPYFRCGYDEAAGKIVSEDFWFSDTVRALGVKLWCDMALSREIEHLGVQRFNLREKPAR